MFPRSWDESRLCGLYARCIGGVKNLAVKS
jgi:hypothetical protein